MRSAGASPPGTLLELGSGGGNNAFHLKAHARLTLVDLAAPMLAESRRINPECEHIAGDMRSLRLGRLFDAVFVQDAISYMATASDLEQAIRTAFVHCRPGGVALFGPDYLRETFRSSTSHGGRDGAGRALRYLEWTWDPDPDDTTYVVDFGFLLRDERAGLRIESERHQLGLFPRAEWLRIIGRAGFEPKVVPFAPGDGGPGAEVLLGMKPPA
jgi:hypothetical protein